MHRIFSGDGWLVFPDILKSARDHCPSQRLLQQPPVLIILCILCIDVPFIVLLDGSAPSRGAGARLAGKREFPKGDRPAFREVARRIPSTSPSGRHHPGARASRPHAVPSVAAQFPCDVAADRPAGGNRMGPAEAEAGAPLPVDSGGGDGRSCERICAGGTPALPGGLPPMTGSHQRDKIAEASWRQLSLKEVHQSLVPIRVHWWFVFIERYGCFSSNDPHGRRGPGLPETKPGFA